MIRRIYGLLMLPIWLVIDLWLGLTGQIPGDPPRDKR